jgi:transmembrane sensor
MSSPERIWYLISRNISGEASENEFEELQRLLEEQPGLKQQYVLLEQFWKAQPQPGSADESTRVSRILQLSAVQEALKEEDDAPVKAFSWKSSLLKIAAIVVGILLTIWVINESSTGISSPRPGVIVSQKGTKTRTILPDGSTVWLNAGSRIEYDPSFNGKQRVVTLYGEAYFDVVKNPDIPFLVHAGKFTIRVLGTVFNVKSYPGEGAMETTLIRGLVQITRDDDKNQSPIFLHPNQKIVLPEVNTVTDPGNKSIGIPGVEVAILDSSLKEHEHIETAWVYNRLEFRGDNFEELAKKLERWYNITILFEDEKAKQLTFNGSIENESVEQAFEALRTAVSFKYKIKDNEVFISSP